MSVLCVCARARARVYGCVREKERVRRSVSCVIYFFGTIFSQITFLFFFPLYFLVFIQKECAQTPQFTKNVFLRNNLLSVANPKGYHGRRWGRCSAKIRRLWRLAFVAAKGTLMSHLIYKIAANRCYYRHCLARPLDFRTWVCSIASPSFECRLSPF